MRVFATVDSGPFCDKDHAANRVQILAARHLQEWK
jgi:hypothetical protein